MIKLKNPYLCAFFASAFIAFASSAAADDKSDDENSPKAVEVEACVRYSNDNLTWSSPMKVKGFVLSGEDMIKLDGERKHNGMYYPFYKYFVLPLAENEFSVLTFIGGSVPDHPILAKDIEGRDWSFDPDLSHCSR